MNHSILLPSILLLCAAQLQGQTHGQLGVPSLKLHANFNPRQERATLLHLGDQAGNTDNSSSYSYLLSLGKGEMLSTLFERGANKVARAPDRQSILSGQTHEEDSMKSVIKTVGLLVKTAANNIEDVDGEREDGNYGFTSLLQKRNDSVHFPQAYVPPASLIVTEGDSSYFMESRTVGPEPRIPPPEPTKTYNLQRTSPHDVVGFSAVRASGFSRLGDSRIFFENTITDANYGWDSRNSIFITHFAGLYFFTFSVKADADKGDNFKYEVSLMKNGEEVVSVGGAIDPSNKNVGTSASTSIILDLVKEDRVWLQLLRGNLVETTNRKTGYSTFSGYRLGCGVFNDKPSDFSEVALEDIAVSLDNESLQTLDESSGNNVDRYGTANKRPAYYEDSEDKYTKRPHVYSDEKLYDAFEYDKDPSRGNLRPAHRPFLDNGPAIVEEQVNHNSQQDGYDDFFSLNDKPSSSVNRYPEDRDRYKEDRDRYKEDRDRYKVDRDRYSEDRDRYPEDRDRYPEDRYNKNKYSTEGNRYYPSRDRYSTDRDKNSNNRDRNTDDRVGYQDEKDIFSNSRDRYSTDRAGYEQATDRSPVDRYNTVNTKPDLSPVDSKYSVNTDRYEYRTPLVRDREPSGNDRYQGTGDRIRDQDINREGTMFFHKRQVVDPKPETVNHISYGK